jgi:hypothetical protein
MSSDTPSVRKTIKRKGKEKGKKIWTDKDGLIAKYKNEFKR